ncbi:MATE family efflux transporter [Clostridium perfringens]|uniref:MATE family efflux transporter n=1 Tax=Clostridium perfringens TaxID=1502 RepID=UPI001FA88787|nr:MATE family efflux transporter [Clostridium perfringens]
MENAISRNFKFSSLIRFTIPSIVMLIFMAAYGIADGVFIARFINTDALSSFNIIYPFINLVIGIGVMLANGGSALIAKKLGELKENEAKQNFTLLITTGVVIGVIIGLIGYIFSDKIIYLLGSTEELYTYCRYYLLMSLIFVPFYILNLLYQMLTITAGKPKIGLILTVIGGSANIILDYVFLVSMNMGILGTALATGLGNLIPALFGTLYFFKNKETLYFVKPKFDLDFLVKSCINGSSEMVANISTGITTMLFNIVLIEYLGSDGVAAISIILYGQFLITSIYIGFSSGVAPVISYNYGEQNKKQIKKVIRYSFIFIISISLISYILSMVMASNIIEIFSSKGSNVYLIGYNGFILFGVSFLIAGINIFITAMFTAFSNGKVSAIISFLRTFVFIACGILILPKFFNITGIWISVPIAEFLAAIISITYAYKYKDIYGYGKII